MAKDAWEINRPARELARQARADDRPPQWPQHPPFKYLSLCRHLAEEIGDAALFAHLNRDDAAAIESVRDLLHMSELLEDRGTDKPVIEVLVGNGMCVLACNRLSVIASGVELTRDAGETRKLQVDVARDLIAQLLYQRPAMVRLAEVRPADLKPPDIDVPRLINTLNRANNERSLAAMSLACHVYRFDKGRWPTALADLIPTYLPYAPVDAIGGGTNMLGFALIKGGLPDGSDRPLIYSHDESKDGLFFRLDEPFFSFYQGDGSNEAFGRQKRGGQFRDVTRWVPGAKVFDAPTTCPLP